MWTSNVLQLPISQYNGKHIVSHWKLKSFKKDNIFNVFKQSYTNVAQIEEKKITFIGDIFSHKFMARQSIYSFCINWM